MAKIMLVCSGDTPVLEASKVLRERGHEVTHVSDGNEALTLFYRLAPDMVVCDHQLSGLSGIEVCRLIKTHPSGHKTIFLLVIRAPSSPQLVKELAQRIQADDLVQKPCSVKEVTEKAIEWLESPQKPVPLYERDVQTTGRPAKAAAERTLPMSGTIAEISFASLLQQLHRAKFDGLLELSDKRKKLRVAFQHGQPVFVQSNYIREDSLGKLLIDAGKINADQLDRALERASSREIKLGQALIDLKYISEKTLEEVLNRQHIIKLLGVFQPRWQEGVFNLHPGPVSLRPKSRADISTVALIQEGITLNSTLKDLLPIFQRKNRLKRICRATPELDSVFGQLKLDSNLIRVTELLRRGMKISDLEALVQMDRQTLLQFIFILLVLRAVRFEEAESDSADQVCDDLAATATAAPATEKGAGAAPPPPKAEPPGDYSQEFYIGKTYFERGDFEKALPHLQSALDKRPACVDCLAMIGWATYFTRTQRDRFATEKAKDLCKQAITKAPNHARAHLYLAKIARAEKNDRLADSYAIKAYQCDPDDPDIKHEYELARIRRRNVTG